MAYVNLLHAFNLGSPFVVVGLARNPKHLNRSSRTGVAALARGKRPDPPDKAPPLKLTHIPAAVSSRRNDDTPPCRQQLVDPFSTQPTEAQGIAVADRLQTGIVAGSNNGQQA